MRTPPVPRALRGALINTWPYRRLRDVALRAHRTNMAVTREDLARRYLSGTGIEIGALIKPLRVPPHVTVRQVDYKSRADLIRDDGPALRALGVDVKRIPEIDVVDDAATLAGFADASVDFVIANHVLEHLEDPIAGLHTWLRVIRPGGTLLLTLPDARHTFDARRERTTVAHLERDHEQGPETSRQVALRGVGAVHRGRARGPGRRARGRVRARGRPPPLPRLGAGGLPGAAARAPAPV